MDSKLLSLHNERCMLTVDLLGGAIIDFHLNEKGLNPLNFHFVHSDSHHEDVQYKGHFVCVPRWGDPSVAELEAGLNKHGDLVRLKWNAQQTANHISMFADSMNEGLKLHREVSLDKTASCFKVVEKLINTKDAKRMYQMVQHPTIAAPFLDENTIVDCNAGEGFDYAFGNYDRSVVGEWPRVITKNDEFIRLDIPDRPYNSVFSFVVDRADTHGWITAYSPAHNTLLGYVWNRADYPWINHWIHWEQSTRQSRFMTNPPSFNLKYRGLEFGTSGVHKPVDEIIRMDLQDLLGEKTIGFLKPGEEHERSYIGFLHSLPNQFKGVEKLVLEKETITLIEKESGKAVHIHHTLNAAHGIQK